MHLYSLFYETQQEYASEKRRKIDFAACSYSLSGESKALANLPNGSFLVSYYFCIPQGKNAFTLRLHETSGKPTLFKAARTLFLLVLCLM